MSRPPRTSSGAALLALVLALVLAACTSGGKPSTSAEPAAASPSTDAAGPTQSPSHAPAKLKPLRAGERRVEVAMPKPYTPSAPYGTGTDDYRCFVLDPHLTRDAYITGLNILPGTPSVVHHVILFRLPPASVAAARAKDAADPGEGWTCFGDTGLRSQGASLDDAPWLGAWAPGGSEQVMADDVGVPMPRGSKVVMQVHYNLLAGPRPDVTTAQLRLAPQSKHLAALRTMLLPAPVELPCRAGHDSSPLCDRAAALADERKRVGSEVGMTADYLHLLCGPVRAGDVQTCDRTLQAPATIRAAAGHMHLLGRAVKVEVDPGTPKARTVLDIKRWNFDDQGARPVRPVRLQRGDTVRVTCRHDQSLRDLLPAFRGQPERYVLWGEGTTDEMCLGILLVTRP
jgi:hypothetical protein